MIFELIHTHWVAAKILMTVFCVTGIALCIWKKLYGVLSFFVFGLIINTMSMFGLGIRHEWIRLLLCFIVLLAIILSGDAVRILSVGSKKNYRIPPSSPMGEEPNGVPTGYDSMDKISDGWQPGNLIVIGACPGVDKTAMILNLVANVAIREDVPVAVFSLEKTSGEIVQRLLETETGLSVKDAQNMTSDDNQKLERGLTSLAKSKIYIDDTPVISISEFKEKASQLVRVKGVRSIFVDCLHPNVPGVSRVLKETAKELNVPIIALAQLNRQVPQFSGSMGRPMLSGIKELEAIEQYADIVMLIHRPDQLEHSDNPSEKDYAEVIVAKNTNGSVFTIPMTYKDSIGKFIERGETK